MINARHLAGTVTGTGTQTVEVDRYHSDVSPYYYVEAICDSGTETLTVKYRLSEDADWSALQGDNTIDLSAPVPIEIRAPIQALQITSSGSGDSYTINVYQA